MNYSKHYIINCTKHNVKINYGFIMWIDKIEKYIFNKYQIYLLDLPDEDYMGYYEDEFEPEIIQKMIEKNNYLEITSI